ncbi:MAG: DNA polymerase V [Rhodobacteraceae bacterium]|nr:DNA polymerase V [Paracoccaceae bacterium]MCY4250038.1 DNA polymerase V [Paracoccaceae bacterium]MCY4306706.1 DNA polymerase V [Paracoccaceae bacterium]
MEQHCRNNEIPVRESMWDGKRPHPELPFYASPVEAGFPSQANDYLERTLDLLVARPSATSLFRASGDSMREAGIPDGSILLVDRSTQARSGMIVLAIFDGDYMVRRLVRSGNSWYLRSGHPDHPNLAATPGTEIQGMVTASIVRFVGRSR